MLKRIFFALTAIVILSDVSYGQNLSKEEEAYIDSLIMESYTDTMPGACFIVTVDGKTVYSKGIGLADMESKRKISPTDLMPIGSVSKQFGAVALLKLVEQGRVSTSDNINKYLPDYNTHGKTMTIANLLSHTSGIPSFTELDGFGEIMYNDISRDEMIDFFESEGLLFDPATDWSYTNSGYFLVGMIIEKVTGMPYHEFAMNEVLIPAGLTEIYFGDSPNAPVHINGYKRGDNSVAPADKIPWPWTLAAGDVISSAGALADWEEALISGKIISKELLSAARTSFLLDDKTPCNYGYGWALSDVEGVTFAIHGGAIPGFLTQTITIPGKKIYVAGLSNTMAVNPTSIVNKIAIRLSGVSVDDPEEVPISSDDLTKLTGVYGVSRVSGRVVANFGDEKMTRNVTVEDGFLYVQETGGAKTKLIHYGDNRFFTEKNKSRFSFNTYAQGIGHSIDIQKYPFQLGPVENSPKLIEQLPEKKEEIVITSEMVNGYLGTYEVQPGFNLKFLFEDGKFYVQATGQDKYEVFAESENKFFLKVVDASFEFLKDDTGKVTSVSFTQGQTVECKKIE